MDDEVITYLTTEDNPWNPFTNWDEWIHYDIIKGYYTCERLARIAKTSSVLPDSINEESTEDAMNQLVNTGAFDKEGNFVKYIKVSNNEPFEFDYKLGKNKKAIKKRV